MLIPYFRKLLKVKVVKILISDHFIKAHNTISMGTIKSSKFVA